MKKFLLMALLSAGCIWSMDAKELSFQYQGETVPQNETVVFDGIEYIDYIPGYYEVIIDPEIFLQFDSDDEKIVKAVSNVDINLCAGTQCESGTKVTKSIIAGPTINSPLNLQMDWSYAVQDFDESQGNPDVEIPYIKVELEAYYADDPENAVRMTVEMGNVAAVETIGANMNNIIVKGKNLLYDVNGASNLCVYSLSGRSLINKNVSGNGTVSLESLPAGIYLYRLNGKTRKTGKFIIR